MCVRKMGLRTSTRYVERAGTACLSPQFSSCVDIDLDDLSY